MAKMKNPNAERHLPNGLRLRPAYSFRADPDVNEYLKNSPDRTHFINKSVRLFIKFINNPAQILVELKVMYPELYKQIGRIQHESS